MATRKENNRFRNKTQGSFTLVELLVVIAIMAILLILVTPSISGILQGQGMTRAIDKVSSTLDKARNTAMSQSTYTFVGLTPSTANGQQNAILCAVSSLDGTTNNAQANLRGVTPAMMLQNISIAAALTKWVPPAQTSSTQPLPNGTVYCFTNTYLGTAVPFNAGSVVVFTPQGEAILQAGVMTPWIEIGLQQQFGNTVNPNRVASILISGVSGQQVISY